LRRRPAVWDLITLAGFVAACLAIVPFLIAFERVRNIVRRRNDGVMIEPAE
jgi:hypothetical protein